MTTLHPTRGTTNADRRSRPSLDTTPLLRLDMTITPAGLRLSVAGELDLATNNRFSAALRRLDPPFQAVVDLTDVTFADSTGLEPLITAVRRHAPTGSLTVTGFSHAVRHVLDLLEVAYQPSMDILAWDTAIRA
jgi:anti-anti-sigma factor